MFEHLRMKDIRKEVYENLNLGPVFLFYGI